MYRPAWSKDSVIGLRQITADPCAKCPRKGGFKKKIKRTTNASGRYLMCLKSR